VAVCAYYADAIRLQANQNTVCRREETSFARGISVAIAMAAMLIPSGFELSGLSTPAREATSARVTSVAVMNNYTDTIRLRSELDIAHRRDRQFSERLSQQS
jgi:hypothetical protein